MDTYFWQVGLPYAVLVLSCCICYLAWERGLLPTNLSFLLARRATRNFSAILFSGIGIVCFIIMAGIYENPRLLLIASLAFELHIYFCLAWSRLNLTPGVTAAVVRPLAALCAGMLWLLQIVLFVWPAGESDPARSTWLWLNGVFQMLFGLGAMAIFLKELSRGLGMDTALVGLRFKYRCFSLAILGSLELVQYATDLTRLVAQNFAGTETILAVCSAIRDPISPLIIFCFGVLLPFDRTMLGLYEKVFHLRQARRQAEQLRWLFERTYTLLPASYRLNLYDYPGLSPDLLLGYVLNSLADVRSWLWEAEAIVRAKNPGPENSSDKAPGPFEAEVRVWSGYLESRETADLVLACTREYSPAGAVPSLPVAGRKSEVKFYIGLAKAVRAEIEHLDERKSGSGKIEAESPRRREEWPVS